MKTRQMSKSKGYGMKKVLKGVDLTCKEINSFLNKKIQNFTDSDLDISFDLGTHYLDAKVKVQYEEIQRIKSIAIELMKKHNITIREDIMIAILLIMRGTSELCQLSRSQTLSELKKRKSDRLAWNKLTDLFNNLKYKDEIEWGSFNFLEENWKEDYIQHIFSEIQFKLKVGGTIRIADSFLLNDLIAILFKHFRFTTLDVLDRSVSNQLKMDSAKILNIIFIHYGNLTLRKGKKTLDKVCRLIFDIFILTKMLTEDELGESDSEDFIRVYIMRSGLKEVD